MRHAPAHDFPLWRRTLAGVAGAASVLCFSALPALADPSEVPANCSGADFAGITAGVAAATSTYLFTHPDVNAFITELESVPRGESATRLVDYESQHPTVRADLAAIRQPIVDFDTRCGYGTRNGDKTHDTL